MHILIVDDEKVIREGVKRTIGAAFPHADVHLAASPEEAARVLRQEPVQIVLTDILMPGMTGLELMDISRRRHPYVKWVVISAYSEFAYAQEAVRLGARDYLLKPIGKERLTALIATLQEELGREAALLDESRLLKQNLKYLREAVFHRLAAGLDTGCLDMTAMLPEGALHLILVTLEGDQPAQLDHFIVDNVLSELIELRGGGFVASLDGGRLLGLVALPEDGNAFDAFREELLAHLRRYVKAPFQLAHSGRLRDIAAVPQEVRRLARETTEPSAAEAAPPREAGAVDVAIQYIKAHYADDLSLEKVASVVYLNAVYFSQLFKHKTGMGYKEYVTQLRMERAKELLADPRLRLVDVAERIGYQDMRHFTQMFRKRFLLTPTEYRQQGERVPR